MARTSRTLLLGVLLLAAPASALTDYWSDSPSTLEECSARRKPGEEVRYWHCYYLFAFEHMNQMAAVNARLERTLRRDSSQNYGALVHAALMDMLVGDRTGSTYYGPVQAEFRRRGDHLGELITVVATLWWASWQGAEEVGSRQYARGLELAREMNDPDALAWVLESGADLSMGLLDYGRAERLVREAEATVTAGAPWWVHWRILYTLARVLAATGRPAESLQTFDRAAVWVGGHIDTDRQGVPARLRVEAGSQPFAGLDERDRVVSLGSLGQGPCREDRGAGLLGRLVDGSAHDDDGGGHQRPPRQVDDEHGEPVRKPVLGDRGEFVGSWRARFGSVRDDRPVATRLDARTHAATPSVSSAPAGTSAAKAWASASKPSGR